MNYDKLDKYIHYIARPDRYEKFSLSELRDDLIKARGLINRLQFELESINERKIERIKEDIERLGRSEGRMSIVDEIQELKDLLDEAEPTEEASNDEPPHRS